MSKKQRTSESRVWAGDSGERVFYGAGDSAYALARKLLSQVRDEDSTTILLTVDWHDGAEPSFNGTLVRVP